MLQAVKLEFFLLIENKCIDTKWPPVARRVGWGWLFTAKLTVRLASFKM